MKVVAFNRSPMMGKGNTAVLPRGLYVDRLNSRFGAALTKWAEKQ